MFLSFIALLATAASSVTNDGQIASETKEPSVGFLSPKDTPEFSQVKAIKSNVAFEPFTGKVTGSKVRLRLQPNLDGVILKELNLGDLLVVTGELDDYYAVRPERHIKGYVYRTYVLDNIVEANNVNLRIEPDTKAPVLTQLGQGDTINGTICSENNKWLMVELPDTVRFYVAKDYVAHLGDALLYDRIETRRQQATKRLTEIDLAIKQELQKNFQDIQLISFVDELKTIIAQNQDLLAITDQAQALIKTTQEEYLVHSHANAHSTQVAQNVPVPDQLDPITLPVSQGDIRPQTHYASFALEQQEISLLEHAIQSGKTSSKEMFYADEVRIAQELMGQIVPYERVVKGRPGDFMLVEAKTKVPVAYLYSCHIDLASYVGQTVRITVAARPNHHFALPAYFVHDLKKW
jgi:hypothetical protein